MKIDREKYPFVSKEDLRALLDQLSEIEISSLFELIEEEEYASKHPAPIQSLVHIMRGLVDEIDTKSLKGEVEEDERDEIINSINGIINEMSEWMGKKRKKKP